MTAEVQALQSYETKAKVFISYSRKDMEFADRLEVVLKKRGFDPMIDRSEIYAFEDWWKRIEALIGQSDLIVFVLSPDAVTSNVALKEVAYAASLNKRFAPIVCRHVEDSTVPEPLRRLNFIFFDDPSRFEASADQLAEALQTDIGWIRLHTEYDESARHWSAAGRPGGLLLRSPALEQAEHWIASRPRSAPTPTDETQAFITESRRSATRRRNVLTSTLAAGLVLALALAGLAYWQRGIAVQERELAVQQSTIAEKRRATTLAELATSERLRGNWSTSLLLGTHAARLALALDKSEAEVSGARSGLATTVWQSRWGLILSGHQSDVYSAVFSPDGSRIVTASFDKTARIWDAETGNQIAVLRGQYTLEATAFSPDGKRIITTSNGSGSNEGNVARIWDAASAKELLVLRGHEGVVYRATFSPDGERVVTGSFDATARIWDAANGKEIAILRHDGEVRAAAFSPDGKRILTASRETAIIWNVLTGKQIVAFRGHEGWITSAAFSPDGKAIVTTSGASGDNTARVWNATTGRQLVVLRGHQEGVESASFSPDGKRIATASTDRTVRMWDVATGKEIAVLPGHEGNVTSVAFSPDGKWLVTASSDWTARVWPTDDSQIAILPHVYKPTSAAFSPDGKHVVTADEAIVHIWEATTGTEISHLRVPEGEVSRAFFSPDGNHIVATGLSFEPVQVWEAGTGNEIAVMRGKEPHASFWDATFSPDGSRIVTASSDRTARIWETATANEVMVLQGHQSDVYSAVFSPDGSRIITASFDGTARIWDAGTGNEIAVLRHDGRVLAAAFSPDGKRIVTASERGGFDNAVHIWDVATNNEIAVIRGHAIRVNAEAPFSPDGRHIVTISGGNFDETKDDTARIWDVATTQLIAVLRGHEDFVTGAAFSPDGTRVVTTSHDGTARIWDVRFATMSANELLTEVCTRRIRGMTKLSRDNMRLAGYTDDIPQIDVCAGVE